MRIVVIDDYPQAVEAVKSALPQHEFAVCSSPDGLDDLLAEDRLFDLAFVDMIFAARESSGVARLTGGLGALSSLSRVRPRPIPSVVYSSDTEANRLLFLVAAAEVFDPVALLSKSDGGDEIRAITARFEAKPRERSFPALYQFPDKLLPRLIPNLTALNIWQALVQPAQSTSTVADRCHESRRTVDAYLQDERLVGAMRDAIKKLPGSADVADQGARMAPAAAFARQHAVFFQDPTLKDLVTNKWQVRL